MYIYIYYIYISRYLLNKYLLIAPKILPHPYRCFELSIFFFFQRKFECKNRKFNTGLQSIGKELLDKEIF